MGPDGRQAWITGHGPWAAMGCLFFALTLLAAWILLAIIVSVLGAIGVIGGPGGGIIQAAALTVIVVGVLAIGSMGRVFNASARTLDALIDVARRLENGDYRARVGDAARGPRPVRQLARAFDTLAERLEADETAASRSSPTSPTSCGPRWRSSAATSRRSPTASTRPTTPISPVLSRRRSSSSASWRTFGRCHSPRPAG